MVGSSAIAQIPAGPVHESQPPPPAASLRIIETGPPQFLPGDATATDLPLEINIDIPKDIPQPEPLDAFLGYRYDSNSLDLIAGRHDQFGMFSIAMDHYQPPGVESGVGVGLQFHFLNGPERTDMPPRVYDFSLAYQQRDRLGVFGYDVAASVMASSDFLGSCRDGIRFPAHAVGFLAVGPTADLVFGVDYLDRGDVKLLPVAGLIVLPRPDVRLEAVFPRPRVVFQLNEGYRLYVCGELGGDTWEIERVTMVHDLATYRDLRVCVGLQSVEDKTRSAIEIGYLFARRLEYTSGDGNYSMADTATIRLIWSR
jgi:hypothetical protein